MAGHTDPATHSSEIARGGETRFEEVRRTRKRRRQGERGAALVEMALVLPLLMMVVFGVIEFGTTYNNYISLRDGVRQSARLAVVGNTTGISTSCNLVGADEASTTVKRIMCLTKREIGLDQTQVRVKVMTATPTFTEVGTFSKNDGLIICAQIPTKAVTGFLTTALTGNTLRTKLAMRIESGIVEEGDSIPIAGDEDPPTGKDWSWCTYDAVSQ